MSLVVEIQNPEVFHSIPADDLIEQWARAAWLDENEASVVIRIVGTEEGLELNQSFRQKDYPTNVLSFPYEPSELELEFLDAEELGHLGDLVLCLPVVEREAAEQNKLLEHHWAHLIVHGLLHLQGFDHEDSEVEAELMEAREIAILNQLGMPNPYESNE
ncbi:rRNA maturation RNase YbeY [uncultured Thiothrix sp.]|jgi:probable rRNA maturation factor|uniref:rRNA maturation RNase YbeY n=1 Tax=uncultured Thiothrix sp. TaxID=223185 RepID=UPI00263584C5|nr:rRNA maturation RNase YbeY [uncultured Thiothrix sp.]HMT92929.1 rRNA maturation RNase YbeY [Thiolinea sp.]